MRERYTLTMHSEEETIGLAKELARLLKAGDVITLEGDLGAGKTTFTKGLAQGLGVKRTVNSPTFTMIKEYKGDLPLYHMDVYRLENSEEDIGFEEYFAGDGISVVEWAQFIETFLPDERLSINITYQDAHTRLLEIVPSGQHFERVLSLLKTSLADD